MPTVSQAAKSTLDNFCVQSVEKLAIACAKSAKNKSIGTTLVPLAVEGVCRRVINRISGPTPTAEVEKLSGRLEPLLRILVRRGVQQGDHFNHEVDDQIQLLSDLL
jgi:hypothetical protein